MRAVIVIGLLAGLMSTTACISPGGTVVGRSAAERPAWVVQDLVSEPADSVYLVFKKSGIYRLELGLKQAQAGATADAKRLLLERVRKELVARAAKQFPTGYSDVEALFDSAIDSVRPSLESPNVAPVQTYHEEVNTETPEGPRTHFDVYVLLTAPKEMFGEALLAVAKRLAASRTERVKQFGDSIVASLQQD